ncbi:MAG: peptide chain release factor N(5)-glutamine methyltransferase [Clostridia bacterium]|nr:peptide chain release factor N(5)-glutamine methyltransferase [Clostridia bacterium]MDD4685663.1 peptide chain release factor N(5)-glutamine methyltransferase [Clostridia bacterium]
MKNIDIFPMLSGNLCIAEKKAVLCFVSQKGVTSLKSYKLKNPLIHYKKIWFLRGLEYLIFATYYFFWGLNQFFLFANKNNSKKNKQYPILFKKSFIIIFTILLSFLLVLFLFGYLPAHLGFWIVGNNYSLFVKKLSIGLTKCLIFYIILTAFYFVPSIKNFYKFNTASNVALNEKNDKLKYHRATNFLNFMVFSLLLSYLVISLIGLNISAWLKPFANLLITLVCFSVSFEFLNLLDTKWRKFKNIILFTSWLVTSKPAQTELQTARAVLCEGNLMIENENRELINENSDGIAFSCVYSEIKDKLHSTGINDKDEADWLIASYLNVPKYEIKFINFITMQQYKDLQNLLTRRLKSEPIAKIFEYTEFYGLKIKVNNDVLTPRQETEILVEKALKIIGKEKLDILDLCTGSGAVAIALAKNTNSKIFASDISDKALNKAKENALNNNVKITFKQGDLFKSFKKKKFDIIVCNPPYIKTDDIKALQKEVKNYDPIISLDGGFDGLYFYKKIAKEAPKYLEENGKLLLEIGINQSRNVKKLLTENFINIKISKDYNGINRIIIAQKMPEKSKKRLFDKNKNK